VCRATRITFITALPLGRFSSCMGGPEDPESMVGDVSAKVGTKPDIASPGRATDRKRELTADNLSQDRHKGICMITYVA
jgi:hypothetical protein